MAVTKIDICNMALSHLGVKAIVALTDQIESARKLNLFYEGALDTVLAEHEWNFADRTGVALAVASGQTVTGWDYVYAMPTKCAALRRVYNEGTIAYKDQQAYKEIFIPAINGKAICSNLEDAVCDYTYQVADVSLFSPSFITAFSLLLAHKVGPSLKGDNYKGEKYQEYMLALDSARATNKSTGREENDNPSVYEDAR